MIQSIYKLFCVVAILSYCPFAGFSQNIGIGTVTPTQAKLVVNGNGNLTQATFGFSTYPNVSIDNQPPFVGFNNYWDGGRKYFSAGYTGAISFDATNGKLFLQASATKGGIGTIASLSTAVTIDSNQNVGIGTISPTSKLQVVAPNTGNWLRLSSTSGTGLAFFAPVSYPTIGFNTEYGSGYDRIGTGFASFFQHSPTTGILNYFSSAVSDNAGTDVSTGGAIFQLTSDGSMGIGGSNSASKVTISHNSTITNPHLRLKENGNDYARVQFENSNSTRFWHIAGYTSATGAASDLLNIYHNTAGDIMSFKGDGTIGVGTTYTPAGYKVSINGRVICTELRVQTVGGWPDYVFANNYQLRSLPELETYIQANSHLPGVPPAAEVEADGITVGDMQKKLMEKVEELTLYIIQQDKTVKALEARLKRLEK